LTTTGNALRLAVQNCEVSHARFEWLGKHLSKRIHDALRGFEPRIERVIGPSRVGKSALIKRLERLFPDSKEQGKRRVPVLVAPVMPGVSWTMLPFSVLTALGFPTLPSGAGAKSGALTAQMKKQLKKAETRVVIFEEASHLVDEGSRVSPRAAGDWIKALSEDNRITVLMFGVPRLERLFRNEQLDGRASAPLEFRPYDSRIEDERRAFAKCVEIYVEIFKKFGYPFELPGSELVGQFYLLTGGRVGILSKFMQELASRLEDEAPRSVTLKDCQEVVAAIGSGGHPDWPAFEGKEASPIALDSAHAHVLATNGMSVRVLRSEGGQ
jgi:hypothetical protein